MKQGDVVSLEINEENEQIVIKIQKFLCQRISILSSWNR
ncbi:hypothetical protein LQK80_01305 [Bacillus thuringiensis]|nr:hypothetical protein [Bacillus thuringiensis]